MFGTFSDYPLIVKIPSGVENLDALVVGGHDGFHRINSQCSHYHVVDGCFIDDHKFDKFGYLFGVHW